MTSSPPITAYTLTLNEARQIRPVLESLKWADEIIVVDSFSTDGTPEIAREYNARVLSEKFCGFGKLRNRALAAAKNDWIFSLDADERCTPAFAEAARLELRAPKCAAYFVPRLNHFLGRPVRFGGFYPDYRQPQVFDRRQFEYRDDLVHESFECRGAIGYFQEPILQHPFPTMDVVLSKTDRYTTLVAQRYFAEGRRASLGKMALHPVGGFLKKFVAQQGFREGTLGFMMAALHAYYTFLKYAKLWELQRRP